MQKNVFRRYLRISQMLRDRRYPSLQDFSMELGISSRTVKRDIKALRDEFNAPIKFSYSFSGYYLTKKWHFQLTNLTEGEILNLVLVTSTLKQFHGTPLEEVLGSIEGKLEALFSDTVSFSPYQYHGLFSVDPNPTIIEKDIRHTFKVLLRSLYNQKQVEIEYYSVSSKRRTIQKVNPYHIFNKNGAWYFCGYCHNREMVCDYALDRIKCIKTVYRSFTVPPSFDPKKYGKNILRTMDGDITKVKIWFDSENAIFIKNKIWSCSQEVEEKGNGEIILKLSGNPKEIKKWVLQFGYHAKIMEPKELQDEIRHELKKTLMNY